MIALLAAAAVALPHVSIERGCLAVGHGVRAYVNACRQNEQDAYDDMKAVWGKLSPATRAYCVDLADVGRVVLPYERLERCVEMRLPYEAATNDRPFRY